MNMKRDGQDCSTSGNLSVLGFLPSLYVRPSKPLQLRFLIATSHIIYVVCCYCNSADYVFSCPLFLDSTHGVRGGNEGTACNINLRAILTPADELEPSSHV